jgi:hypothetical protein
MRGYATRHRLHWTKWFVRSVGVHRRYAIVNRMKILVVAVGGTHVTVHRPGHEEPVKIPSGPKMTAKKMVEDVKKVAAGWKYSAASIGYPGSGCSRTTCQRTLQSWARVGGLRFHEPSVIALRWSTIPLCRRWGATKEGACSSWVWAPGWVRH